MYWFKQDKGRYIPYHLGVCLALACSMPCHVNISRAGQGRTGDEDCGQSFGPALSASGLMERFDTYLLIHPSTWYVVNRVDMTAFTSHDERTTGNCPDAPLVYGDGDRQVPPSDSPIVHRIASHQVYKGSTERCTVTATVVGGEGGLTLTGQ